MCPGAGDPDDDPEAPCSTVPAAVLGGITFTSVSVGNGHTCGLNTGGSAYCWGVNNDRRLGTGDTITSVAPVAVTGGLTFASVDAGGAHTCGISTAAIAYCWGSNENGALGSAPGSETCLTLFVPRTSIPCSATPVAVGGGLAFASLDVSEAGQHTCALTETGTAYCWGRGGQGQIGSGGTTGDPQIVPGVPDFVSVSAGADHSCGVTGGGEAYCWGGQRQRSARPRYQRATGCGDPASPGRRGDCLRASQRRLVLYVPRRHDRLRLLLEQRLQPAVGDRDRAGECAVTGVRRAHFRFSERQLVSHLRGRHGWGRLLLGRQRVRPVGHRHDGGPGDSGPRGGPAVGTPASGPPVPPAPVGYSLAAVPPKTG